MDIQIIDENVVRKRKQIRTAPKENEKKLTANQLAINKLDGIVNKKVKGGGEEHLFNQEDYVKYRKVLVMSNQLIHMNMQVLARVLHWLSDFNNELTDQAYNEMNNYFEAIVDKHINPTSIRGKNEGAANKFTKNEIKIINLRMKFEFKRYADFVLRLLSEQRAEAEEFEESNFGAEQGELVHERHEQEIYYNY
jgi:hypothetical protein